MIRYPCTCSEEDLGHDYLGELTKDGAVLYTIECSGCGLESSIPKEDWDEIAKGELIEAQRRRSSLTKFPYIEPHTGEVVKSKEHREEVLRAHGYHKAEHGINDAYNDELCDKLRTQRQAAEQRKRDIRKKRETLIREGVIKKPRQVHASRL